jgi:hypothetical protein
MFVLLSEIKRSEMTSLKTNFNKVTDKEKSPLNFIIAKKVKKEYSRIKKPLNGILHGMTHSNLEFDASPEAELLVLEIESFGTIAISANVMVMGAILLVNNKSFILFINKKEMVVR